MRKEKAKCEKRDDIRKTWHGRSINYSCVKIKPLLFSVSVCTNNYPAAKPILHSTCIMQSVACGCDKNFHIISSHAPLSEKRYWIWDMCFDLIYKTVYNISNFRNNWVKFIMKLHSLNVKYLLCLSDFSNWWTFSTDILQLLQKQFNINPSSGTTVGGGQAFGDVTLYFVPRVNLRVHQSVTKLGWIIQFEG